MNGGLINILSKSFNVLFSLFVILLKAFISILRSIISACLTNNNNNSNSLNTNLIGTNSSSLFNLSTGANSLSNIDSLTNFNNCLKWFYFNSETTRKINNSILNLLNNNLNGIKAPLKYDDIQFKSVDSLPPKFGNIKTVLNDNDNLDDLTLNATLEFSNIDFKVEFRRSQRQLDIKGVNVTGQVIIILNQNKSNNLFNIECYIDQQNEINVNIKKEQNIEQQLVQYLENLIKYAAKQQVVSLEMNFFNKKVNSSTKTMSQLQSQHQAHQQQQQQQSQQVYQRQPSPPYRHQSPSPKPPQQFSNNQSSQIQQQHQNQMNFNNSMIQSSQQQQAPQSPQSNRNVSVDTAKIIDSTLQNMNASHLRNNFNEKRLLVKLIKATNLSNCEEPYCVVELDYPMQKHLTDVHKDMSTINEQFLFDIISGSEELSFSIYDRAKDYGNDLIGEAVLPVNDLISSINSKRVIQLHKFGQTKTGSITVEFVFIEPNSQNKQDGGRLITRESLTSRGSRSPYEQFSSSPINYRDMSPEQKQDNLSSSSFSPTQIQHASPTYQSVLRSSFTPADNFETARILANKQPIQNQQQSSPGSGNITVGGSNSGRVINRNYLQIQSNNYNNKLVSSQLPANSNLFTVSPVSTGNLTATGLSTNIQENSKRTKSLSRSLRSLFSRPTSVSNTKSSNAQKRDKSYETPSISNQNYDIQSDIGTLKKSTIGGNIKKLFNIKRGSKKYHGSIHEQRPGSPTSLSIQVSRPVDPNMPNTPHRLQHNQLKFYPPANLTSRPSILQQQHQLPQEQNNRPLNSNFLNMMNFQASNKQHENYNNNNMTYSNQPLINNILQKENNLLLKRGYISP